MNNTFISSVKWCGHYRKMPTLNGLARIGSTALWHFIKPDPATFDPHFRDVREFYGSRKPWKIVTPWFMQSVMDWWFVEVEWDGKPVEPERWTAIWSAMFDVGQYGSTYETRDLVARIRFGDNTFDEDVGTAMDEYDDYMYLRKPWKVLTKAHVELVVHNFGGKLV